MDNREMIGKLLDKAVEEMPEPSRTRAKKMMEFFDLLKGHHGELGRLCDRGKSVSHESDSIQSLTSIAVLIRCMIVYVLEPVQTDMVGMADMLMTMTEQRKKEILADHELKVTSLYEIGKKIIENSKPANVLPYHEKYNGEHKIVHEYIDDFSEKLLPYTEVEMDIIRLISGVIIYMTDAIRHAVYCTFENKTITNPSHFYISAMTELFAKQEKRRGKM